MARRVDPLDVSHDEYRAIFGDFVEDDTGDIDGDSSDIDFEDIDEDSEEIDEENGDEEAAKYDEEEQQWADDLSNITVDEFSAQSGIVVDVGAGPKADDLFGEDLFDKIMETNRYAPQMLADNKQRLG